MSSFKFTATDTAVFVDKYSAGANPFNTRLAPNFSAPAHSVTSNESQSSTTPAKTKNHAASDLISAFTASPYASPGGRPNGSGCSDASRQAPPLRVDLNITALRTEVQRLQQRVHYARVQRAATIARNAATLQVLRDLMEFLVSTAVRALSAFACTSDALALPTLLHVRTQCCVAVLCLVALYSRACSSWLS